MGYGGIAAASSTGLALLYSRHTYDDSYTHFSDSDSDSGQHLS